MGDNDRDFEKLSLSKQVGRQCGTTIAVQKYGNNYQGGADNNRFSNGFGNRGGGNNNGFRCNSKQSNKGFRQ